MTLRDKLCKMGGVPDVNMAAAVMYILYKNRGLAVNLFDPTVIMELRKLADMSNEDFNVIVTELYKSYCN